VKGLIKALLYLGILMLVACAGAGYLVLRFLSTPVSDSTEQVIFEVRPGESFKVIARHLEEQKLVSSASKIEYYARLSHQAGRVRVGEYALRRNFKPREIMAVLASGHSIEYAVTVSEGLNRFEIADIFEKQKVSSRADFLALTTDKSLIKDLLGKDLASKDLFSLEGYLFPETYHITKYTGAKGLVRMMVERFKENYAKAQGLPGWNKHGLTDEQILTLASIVEKETGAPEERPVIASVFYNRLKKRMPLQTDPTIIYGLWLSTGAWNRNLSRADLQTPGPYNSYTNMGLPPGPISNPGFEALKAVGLPAESEYLFFVSRNNGTHVFSKEYSEHQQAVSDFQMNSKAREGHSWRDLKNRKEKPEKVFDANAMKAQKAKASKPAEKQTPKPVSK
jgi:UPF0755 protein